MPTRTPAQSKCRVFVRTFLAVITILLGVSGAFGGGIIMYKAGNDGGKLLGGLLCIILGLVVGFVGPICCCEWI